MQMTGRYEIKGYASDLPATQSPVHSEQAMTLLDALTFFDLIIKTPGIKRVTVRDKAADRMVYDSINQPKIGNGRGYADKFIKNKTT